MSDFRKRPVSRQRHPKNTVTNKSGKNLKLNRGITERYRASRRARQERRAVYLSSLPKNRYKRWLYRMHPRRLAQFWFSRDGAIMALKITGIGIVVCFFLILGVFAYFRKDLPKLKDLNSDTLGGSITYYDRTGKVVLWQDYDAVKRVPVESNDISKYMKDATVAIEDKDFYNHGAFDMRGIMRAGFHDVFGGGGGLQGGSTITQQLVKLNEQWTDNRTITRKVKELILAIELEREYSKDDILTGYLNIAPYGSVEYGVESAARDYFHTDAKNLTLAQAAMLAAIPKSPGVLSPYDTPKYNPSATVDDFDSKALLDRQHYILDQMAQQGYITQKQADAAKKVNILSQIHSLESRYSGIKAPYFVLAAKQQLEEKYGATTVQRGGWKVITTLDMNLQNEAEKAVQDNYALVSRYGADEEATVMEDVPTGQIVALVGGVDFYNKDHGQVNYAASVKIAPGSSIKPYDYSTLINNSNAGAGSVLYDSLGPVVDPKTGQGYPCTNHSLPPPVGNGNCIWDYERNFPGPETIRYALGGSRNIPAVKATVQAGVAKTQQTATEMMDPLHPKGSYTYNCYRDEALTKVSSCGPSAAIGDGAYLTLDDHVNGLATLGRMGKAVPRTFILKIVNASGKTVDQWSQSWANANSKQVISPQTAYIMNNMLSDPKASYFFANEKFQHWNGWDFAVKTGTTNDYFDTLMTAWSTKYAVVSWVGNHTRNVPVGLSSDTATIGLTRTLMEYAHKDLKPDNWKEPAGIQHLPAYVITKHIGYGSVEPSPSIDIYPSWYKPRTGAASAQTIDKVSGKLATTCTPADAKETVYNGDPNVYSIDEFYGGGSHHVVTGNDDVHDCGDSPPSIDALFVNGQDVTNGGSATCDKQCTITATVSPGTHPLAGGQYGGTLVFTLGGNTIHTFDLSTTTSPSFTFTPTSSGSEQLVATVTDSVLYQDSASATVDFTSGGGGNSNNQNITIQSPQDGSVVTHDKVKVSWTGEQSSSYTVSMSGPGGFSGSCHTNNTSCSIDTGSGDHGQYTVIVTADDTEDKSSPVTFTKG